MVRELPIYTAGPLMILVGALDSSLLSLPEVNDYITVWRVAHHPHEVYFFPLFPAIGSVMGCLVLYRVARGGEEFIERRFHPRHLQWAKDLYRRWGLFALVIPALLPPMPFKMFVATAAPWVIRWDACGGDYKSRARFAIMPGESRHSSCGIVMR
jgi:membrane protein YqaA with SNARE-associated domain